MKEHWMLKNEYLGIDFAIWIWVAFMLFCLVIIVMAAKEQEKIDKGKIKRDEYSK